MSQCLNIHVALQNSILMSIYYTGKYKAVVQKQTQKNSSNVEWWVRITRWFVFSVRYSRLYLLYHKKHEKFPNNRPIHIYINRINNRLMFKIKNQYRLELQKPETMKLFGSSKNLIDKRMGKMYQVLKWLK